MIYFLNTNLKVVMTSYNIMSPKHIIFHLLNYLKSNFVHHNKKNA